MSSESQAEYEAEKADYDERKAEHEAYIEQRDAEEIRRILCKHFPQAHDLAHGRAAYEIVRECFPAAPRAGGTPHLDRLIAGARKECRASFERLGSSNCGPEWMYGHQESDAELSALKASASNLREALEELLEQNRDMGTASFEPRNWDLAIAAARAALAKASGAQ